MEEEKEENWEGGEPHCFLGIGILVFGDGVVIRREAFNLTINSSHLRVYSKVVGVTKEIIGQTMTKATKVIIFIHGC